MWVQLDATTQPWTDLLGPALAVTEDCLYLHGGRRSSSGLLSNQLWQYGLTTGVWDRISVQGEAPSARSGHTLVALRGGLVVVGGYTTAGRSRDAGATPSRPSPAHPISSHPILKYSIAFNPISPILSNPILSCLKLSYLLSNLI